MKARRRKKVVTNNPAETVRWGMKLAAGLKGGDIICLVGDLGAGKTTLVKGIAKGLKIKETRVNSPTFVLLNTYEGRLPLYHFDLYRIDQPQDILDLGYEEFLFGSGVCVIEWADKLGALLPEDCLTIHMTAPQENERSLQITASAQRSRQVLKNIFS